MYLLDTNVVSERRKPRPHGGVVAWIESIPAKLLYVSAMTIAEIQAGVERTRETDAAKALELESWLIRVIASSQILAMDEEIGRVWAKLMHTSSSGLAEDGWIAATAKHYGFIVVTRDVRDFAGFGVEVLNPFEYR